MLLIFDWDGTLADSEAHIVRALQQAGAAVGLPERGHQQCAVLIGLGLREAAQRLYQDLSERDIDDFCASYSEHFRALEASTFGMQLFEGAESTLVELQRRGHSLAVATGKSRAGLDRALTASGLHGAFLATRTADESQSKPDPTMLKQLLALTKTSTDAAVMIGDTSFDMQMAASIGMAKVAANYGVHGVDELEAFQPEWSMNSIVELLDWPDLR